MAGEHVRRDIQSTFCEGVGWVDWLVALGRVCVCAVALALVILYVV